MTDHNQPPTCSCPGDPSASAAGWSPECRIHGTAANRHPHYREDAPRERDRPPRNEDGTWPLASRPAPGTVGTGPAPFPPIVEPDPDAPHPYPPPPHPGPFKVRTDSPPRERCPECPGQVDGPHMTDCPIWNDEQAQDWGHDDHRIEREPVVPRPPGWVEANVAAIDRDIAYVSEHQALAGVVPEEPIRIKRGGLRWGEGNHDVEVEVGEDRQHTARIARRICETAADLVNGPRNVDYGDARDNFTETAALWSPILGVEVTAEQVALCMAQVKIARLIHNTGHADSWLDGVGYLALGGGIAERTRQETEQ